jgi:hypothetical protein
MMGRFDNLIKFLATHEDPKKRRMNRRTTISPDEVSALRAQYPGIPNDYIAYLTEIGWGSFRECQYMVYRGPIKPESMFGVDVAQSLQKRVLCFGDNFSGDPGCFLPDSDWAIAEIWHDDLQLVETNKSFAIFIREQMLMDEDGNDLRLT